MDKLELQRLFDGELDHEQRRRVLDHLDNHPAEWRTVALAMLEEQAFCREFSSLRATQSLAPLRPSTCESESTLPVQTSVANKSEINRWLPMTLAASMLIAIGAFGGNRLASRWSSSNPTSPSSVLNSVASVPPPQVDQDAPVSDVRSLRPIGELKFASDVSSNVNGGSAHVPMFEAAPEDLRQMLMAQQKQIQQWNDQLRRRGFEIDWQPEMIESRLPDGRSVVVPIQEVRVRSLGQ
jgi:hypothetical protein